MEQALLRCCQRKNKKPVPTRYLKSCSSPMPRRLFATTAMASWTKILSSEKRRRQYPPTLLQPKFELSGRSGLVPRLDGSSPRQERVCQTSKGVSLYTTGTSDKLIDKSR